jgi:hypothetical protein
VPLRRQDRPHSDRDHRTPDEWIYVMRYPVSAELIPDHAPNSTRGSPMAASPRSAPTAPKSSPP